MPGKQNMFVVHDNHYMHFTSPCFAVDIRIPQRRVVLEVGASRPCGQAFRPVKILQTAAKCIIC